MVFALFNVVWSTLFLEEWKRRGAELAYKWGTLDSPGEAVEEPRPQFRVSRGMLSSRTLKMPVEAGSKDRNYETKLQYQKGCAKRGRSIVSKERGGKLDLRDREGCTRWGHCASKGTMERNWEGCGKGVWGRGSPLASCWARPLSSARACDASAL